MKKMQVAVSALLMVLLLAACAPTTTSAPQVSAAPAPAPAASPASVPSAASAVAAKPAWQVEWDRVLVEARKEGKVTFATSAGPMTRATIIEAFRSKFGISSEWLAGSSGELTVKIKAERRARIYSIDATMLGAKVPVSDYKPAGILERLDDMLFLPELTDPQEIQKVWRNGVLPWADKDHTALNFLCGTSPNVVVNTQLVQPGEIKAFRDLLAPKWKGKIVMGDPTLTTGPGATLTKALGDYIMGWDFVRQLAAQQPMITADGHLQLLWVAQGKYAIALGVRAPSLQEFLDAGAPVKILSMEEGEYSSSGEGTITVVKDAPHPNAAKLFLNWLLTKEGQTLFSRTSGRPSSRLDVSTEGLPRESILDPKLKYVDTSSEEWALGIPEAQKKATEIFGKLR